MPRFHREHRNFKHRKHRFDHIVHKALSSDVRRDILLTLKDNEKYLSEIAEEINKKPQTIDFHLNLLMEIGLISSEVKDGKKFYKLVDNKIIDFLKDHKPLPHHLHPKAPHEVMVSMLEKINERLDSIDKRLSKLEKK